MLGIELLEWRRVLFAMGDRRYPGLGVCPPLYVYDQERPGRWPSHGTLLRVAGLPKNAAGWAKLVEGTTQRKVPTPTQAANLTWAARHRARLAEAVAGRDSSSMAVASHERAVGHCRGDALTADERHMAARRRAREHGEMSGLAARERWRPLLEWRPLPGGGWGYVEVGRYSVWQLI